MASPEPVDLSSCVLCGRPLDGGETVEAAYGGMAVEVHPGCREDGLEGADLASPHADPDGLEDEGAGGEEGGPAPDRGTDGGSSSEGEMEGAPDEVEGTPEEGGSSSPPEDRGGGARERADGDGGGDPDWTRISDFT